MTRQETAKILSLLNSVWSGEVVDAAKVNGYHLAFADMPYPAVEQAAARWIRTGRYFPVPAELLNLIADTATAGFTAGDAWEQATRFVRRYGFDAGRDRLEELDIVTRETVRQIGWRRFCLDDNSRGYIRRDFDVAFAAVAERHKRDVQSGIVALPERAHQAIAS